MSSECVLSVSGIGKCYQIYEKPRDRLLQMVVRAKKKYFREFWALRNVTFNLNKGDCLGIIGENGAGKSTLLQMICGTLTPTHGQISTTGRISALLELGAGFSPDFTGHENIYLSAAILGLSASEIDSKYDEIVDFSGVRAFIHQPVKTYSSGMYVRLAFSVATCVNPDILIIDEALSVGDGKFAKKSFDRIKSLKANGATILFCSHSLYHIESVCNKALWLEAGEVKQFGTPENVTMAYSTALTSRNNFSRTEEIQADPIHKCDSLKLARIEKITAISGEQVGTKLKLNSCLSDLLIRIEYSLTEKCVPPAIAVGIEASNGVTVSGVGSFYDQVQLQPDAEGKGVVELLFPRIPLMRGVYLLSVFLACEQLQYIYDHLPECIEIEVTQTNIIQGMVVLPHQWVSGCTNILSSD